MVKKILIGVGVVVLLAAIAAAGAWKMRIEPYLLIEDTRWVQMATLEEAVIIYSDRHKKLPTSLEEIVKDGILPETGVVYFNPMKHGSRKRQPISYRDCEFEFTFSPEEVTISVPKDVHSKRKFAWATGNSWTHRVPKGASLSE